MKIKNNPPGDYNVQDWNLKKVAVVLINGEGCFMKTHNESYQLVLSFVNLSCFKGVLVYDFSPLSTIS